RLTELAQRIDPRAFANFAANPATGDARSAVSSVLARAPSPATRAAIDEAVRALERTGEALEQHREADASEAAAPNPDDEPAPPPQARAALRVARTAVAGNANLLQRLAELPAAIEAAR